MSAEHAVDTPALEERRTSLTRVVAGTLRGYGVGAAQPVLLDDTTNLVFRILPLGPQHHTGGDDAATADHAGRVASPCPWAAQYASHSRRSPVAVRDPARGGPDRARPCPGSRWVSHPENSCARRTDPTTMRPVSLGAGGLPARHTDAPRPARRGGVHGAVARPRSPVCRLTHPPTHAALSVL
jgi:hypothetical protein